MKAFITIFTVLFLTLSSKAAIYSVLVAGSNGYYNYRHQADICHAYQILINNGVPADNIIVMAYNDIAYNIQNPFLGQIFNKPSANKPGVNVYQGCKIDYTRDSVTPENYIAIITGNKTAVKGGNGRVLTSGQNDKVFLNFADHGGSGLIAFPEDYLYADQLQSALQIMNEKKMYSQLTYYLESCESGSMFQNLPDDWNIYAVSASSPDESSWGTFCPPNDVVDGKDMQTCLGDLFSVVWMENSEFNNPAKETLQTQFFEVSKIVQKSEVMQWGTTTFTNEPVGDFIGSGNGKFSRLNQFMAKLKKVLEVKDQFSGVEDTRISTVTYWLRKVHRDQYDLEAKSELKNELDSIERFDFFFESFRTKFQIPKDISLQNIVANSSCYRPLVQAMEQGCGRKSDDYSRRHFKYLYHFCSYPQYQNLTAQLEAISLAQSCGMN